MNLKAYTLSVALSLCCISQAQEIHLQPCPQRIKATGALITLPSGFRIFGIEDADRDAVNKLKTLLLPAEEKKGYSIYIGEKGDKAVKKFARFVPSQPESYYLSVDKEKLVLVGNDERGTYYAVQTLSQLLKDNQLPEIEIADYPDIRYRGVVEGFYGQPWSYSDRVSQLKFYGDNKLNTYIYGPKDDPYHSSPNWRLPYPEKEAEQLAALVKIAKQNKVNFVWAIHPGQDIKWNDSDREALLDKFEKMYGLGVRSFAVFFDDISGDGTDPQRQAELLNYIDNRFVKVKPDVTPLIMCPTEYNKSWSNPAKGYLTTLGDVLNPSIHIMWTGDRVISDISKPGLDWINTRIKRPAYIWWNFPVSDYVRDHLLMGPVYGNDTHIKNDMSGFVANPMEHAEASKIAIYSVADYTWNMEKYDSNASWKSAINYLLPHQAEALLTFASHNSDLGKNGHGYRRDESVAVKPVAESFLQAYRQERLDTDGFRVMKEEFDRMEEAADILLVSKDNRALIEEIEPWLYQFKLLGETGNETLDMLRAFEQGDKVAFLRKYNHINALKERSFEIDQTYNQNPYQPGVKTGSLVLKPFIDNIFVLAVKRYNAKYNDNLSVETDYSPHKIVSDVEQIKNLPLQIKTNRIAVSPLLEVVRWKAGQFVQINLDKAYPLLNVEMNLGVEDVAGWGVLEFTEDGQHWKKAGLISKNNTFTATFDSVLVKAIRFTNTGDDREVYLRRFVLTIEK